MNDGQFESAEIQLRQLLARKDNLPFTSEVIHARDQVMATFGPIFTPDRIGSITKEDFLAFLDFKNNRHWTGLHRHGPKICKDMSRLGTTLAGLVDESRSIEERIDEAVTSVPGLGKAVVTAVLPIAHPERYGVWNGTSEAGLQKVGLWPERKRGDSAGKRYAQINQILTGLAQNLNVDLWTLDGLWWSLINERGKEPTVTGETELGVEAPESPSFGLERHLHEFLRDNWDKTSLGHEWVLYSEAGDDEAGYEYTTAVGRIDLLARHRTKPEWLVVELKRGQSSDDTVGQLLRYMGWVRMHLA